MLTAQPGRFRVPWLANRFTMPCIDVVIELAG
jgi:hypothetical protein